MSLERVAVAIRVLKAEGLSVLLSEQNLHFATAVADRAYIIRTGRMRFEGARLELAANEAMRSNYLAVSTTEE